MGSPFSGDGFNQFLGIGVARVQEQFTDRAGFHDAALFQHRYGVGNAADDGQVVGHEQVGQSQFALQGFQQRQDLCLHCDIQR